ncbi:acetolactate synthase small subunit [Methanobrevibacter sp. DSM 116169]|uniref:acetolactate synthase small subunit n=1 Tax=Methanobrevibacter sp. DSM 116169 TaxID=3242727 RepID=UPI0038FC9DE0
MIMESHVISTLVENKPGVLQKVASLFTRRSYNIDSITVGQSEVENLARMVIVVNGNEQVLEQVTKQLNKLVDVVKVKDLDQKTLVKRELCLIQVKVNNESSRSEIIQYANIYNGEIIDVCDENITLEVTGNPQKIDSLINLLKHYGIIKIARTGPTAISRGNG